MTLLCTYKLTNDTGLAPNPYWGFCTLAVCTPNRQGANVKAGDWIAGFTTRGRGYRLIYAMAISERVHMNDYFHDQRFSDKKPDLRGDWKARCGDNFYSLEDGKWRQHRNRFHISPEYLAKDTRKPYVFVAKKFWYFGCNAIETPLECLKLIGGRGIRVNHPESLVSRFIQWVETYPVGIHGIPNDNPDLVLDK
jgi:hypothetical protein